MFEISFKWPLQIKILIFWKRKCLYLLNFRGKMRFKIFIPSYIRINCFNFGIWLFIYLFSLSACSLVKNQSCIRVEIKWKLKIGKSRYYTDQTLLSSVLLCKNLKIKTYKTIILVVVLYGHPLVPITKAWRVPWVADGGVGLQIWRLAANILDKQSWTADQERSSSLGFWVRLTTSHCKNHLCSEMSHRAKMEEDRSAFKILTG